jgi:hypothetical protein
MDRQGMSLQVESFMLMYVVTAFGNELELT